MSSPVFKIVGVARLCWRKLPVEGAESDLLMESFDSKGRSIVPALLFKGLQIDPWYFQEGIYTQCDELRVFDRNLEGDQLDFGRFVVRFFEKGSQIGEHIADVAEEYWPSRQS